MNKFISCLCILAIANVCYAGGGLPGEERKPAEEYQERRMERTEYMPPSDCDGWGSRFAAGAPVWMFQEENSDVGGGIYYDLYPKCGNVNFRIGGEVGHLSFDQDNARPYAERPGDDAEVTFVRVPLAVEYMSEIAEDTLIFAGLGPDIINTANDISDTSVGLHVSARLLYNFAENWGAAVEAGYMWGEVEDGKGDVDLDNTFIIPTISYTF